MMARLDPDLSRRQLWVSSGGAGPTAQTSGGWPLRARLVYCDSRGGWFLDSPATIPRRPRIARGDDLGAAEEDGITRRPGRGRRRGS